MKPNSQYAENQRLKAELAAARKPVFSDPDIQIESLRAQNESLAEQLAAARLDAERVVWFLSQHLSLETVMLDYFVSFAPKCKWTIEDWRAAIDSARKRKEPKC
jgi:hypothetical protein